MPSPFPGMDPYLEHPLLWSSVQQYFLGTLADILGEVLSRQYKAQLREQVYRNVSSGRDYAERNGVLTVCVVPAAPRFAAAHRPPEGVSPVWHIPTAPEEVRESYLEIVPANEPAAVQTVVEFLTLGNKLPDSPAHTQYLARQKVHLAAGCNVLEIDLLRAGQHTVLAPQSRVLRRGRYHYLVSLCRAGGREFCEVWGVPLRERLPRVALPVGEEEDLVLDLQSLFTRCYDEGGYGRQVDYEEDAFFPLSLSDARWAEAVLQQVKTGS